MLRRFLSALLVVLALTAVISSAAGPYTLTVNTTVRQDAKLEARRVKLNTATCAAASLPASCTQAQARAVNPGVFVFPDIQAMLQKAAQDTADGIAQFQDTDDATSFCTAWKTLTLAQQQNACTTKLGLDKDCAPCP